MRPTRSLRGPNEGTFDCQQTAELQGSGRTGTATVTSPDGTTTWSFAPAPGQDKGEGSRDIVGKGSEHDAPEANAPTSTATASPVNVSGSMNVIDTHLGFLLVTGSARFSESGTAP